MQYGPRIAAFVVYLLQVQFLPEDRLVEMMADLFGVRLAAATIARMSRACAERCQGFVDSLALLVKTAAVKHLDETGFRVGGKTQWLHVACTLWLSFYRVSPKRGSLLDGVTGIMVHDHWKPYYTMKGVLHALWNAHHLRELQALVEIEKEPWAFRMQRLLRRTGHNLLLRLTTRKDDVLRFLTDPTVPFTNNLAEQAVRMMKLRQKISGGFRSEEGAGDFAVIRSFIATAKKQGWNLIHALTQDPTTLVQHLRLA